MSEILLVEFGIVLTGRPYGKDCYEKIGRRNLIAPYVLNFKGVISLGSSFGEEIVVPLSKQTREQLVIIGANPAVKNCLEKIQTDFSLKLAFQ